MLFKGGPTTSTYFEACPDGLSPGYTGADAQSILVSSQIHKEPKLAYAVCIFVKLVVFVGLIYMYLTA